MGNGWASELMTYFVKSMTNLSSLNSKYRYLRVSDKKNDSIMSRCTGFSTFTLASDVYPFGTFAYFSKPCKRHAFHVNAVEYKITIKNTLYIWNSCQIYMSCSRVNYYYCYEVKKIESVKFLINYKLDFSI